MNSVETVRYIDAFKHEVPFDLLGDLFSHLDFRSTYLIICHIGYRSKYAADRLLDLNIPAISIRGGIKEVEDILSQYPDRSQFLETVVNYTKGVAVIIPEEVHKKDHPLSFRCFRDNVRRFETAPQLVSYVGNLRR
jgi:hypothetical protein